LIFKQQSRSKDGMGAFNARCAYAAGGGIYNEQGAEAQGTDKGDATLFHKNSCDRVFTCVTGLILTSRTTP
jgi:hypothetical protein